MNNEHPTQTDFNTAIFLHAKDLTKSDILCYHALGALGETAGCQAYQDEIATQAGLSGRQTQRSLKKLEEIGLISIDRSRRHHHSYHFTYPKPAAAANSACPVNTTHESPQSDKKPSNTLNTTKTNKSNTKKQLTLIENNNLQNLGSLDIDAQGNLKALDINPDLTQPFSSAPKLLKKYTPAQILILHDPEGEIAANLELWSETWRAGKANLVGLKPALIWCKIVEGQEPPLVEWPFEAIAVEVDDVLGEDDRETRGHGDKEQGGGGVGEYLGVEALSKPVGGSADWGDAEQGRESLETSPLTGGAVEAALGHPEAEIDPLADVWDGALSVLSGQMTRAAFATYLASSKLLSIEGNVYTIAAPGELIAEWIEHRLAGVIKRALVAVVGGGAVELKVIAGGKVSELGWGFV